MKAAGYVRVSTREQALEGYSLDAQERTIRAYCTAMGWDVTEVYIEPGRSGKNTIGREALARIMTDAKAGLFDKLVIWNLKRLARNLRDTLAISAELEAAGVALTSVTESFDASTAQGRMIRNVLATFAEYDRESIVEAIKLGISDKAHEGHIVGPLSLGYVRHTRPALSASGEPRLDSRGNPLVVTEVLEDPITAPRIRQMFEMYARGGISLRQMAEWAGSVGLRSTTGGAIDRLSVRKILTNDVYCGLVSFHKRRGEKSVAPGNHPAIVPRELFDQVQSQLVRRQTAPSPVHFGKVAYPLTGIGLCSHCGASLMGSRKGEYRYMRCSTAARHGKHSCAQPMVQAQILEAQVASYVAGMSFPAEYVDAVVAELHRRHGGTDEGRRLKVQGEIERWRRLFVIQDIDEQEYRDRVAGLRRELAILDVSAQPLDIERALSHLRNAGELWSEADPHHQRAFVESIFDAITVDGPQITELRPKPEFAPLFKIDRHQRFDGDFCIVAPRAGLEPTATQLINPRTLMPFAVPALVAA